MQGSHPAVMHNLPDLVCLRTILTPRIGHKMTVWTRWHRISHYAKSPWRLTDHVSLLISHVSLMDSSETSQWQSERRRSDRNIHLCACAPKNEQHCACVSVLVFHTRIFQRELLGCVHGNERTDTVNRATKTVTGVQFNSGNDPQARERPRLRCSLEQCQDH